MARIPRVELSSEWWEEVRPSSVKSRELERGLERLEEAEKAHGRRPSEDTQEKLLERLEAVEEAIEDAEDELERSEDEIEEALEKLLELVEKRREELEREELATEERSTDALFDLETLRDQMRLLGERPMTFAFGVGQAGGAHLVLDRSRKGLLLMNELEKASGFRQSTFGLASAQGRRLHLEVQGPRFPNLEREVREYLRANTTLPFRQVRVGSATEAAAEAQPTGEQTGASPALSAEENVAGGTSDASLARKASETLTQEIKSVADRVRESVDRLRILEQELLSRGEDEKAFLVRKKRELIERAIEEGARRVRMLRHAAERLVEQKTGKTRRSIERTVRSVTERLARAKRIAEEGLEWLKSS